MKKKTTSGRKPPRTGQRRVDVSAPTQHSGDTRGHPQSSTTTLAPKHAKTQPDRPAFLPIPEVAHAIRSQTDRILDDWRDRTLFSLSRIGKLTVEEFMENVGRTLSAIADALESDHPPDVQRLMQAAPAPGFQRFMKDAYLAGLLSEERMLRTVVFARVEEALGRQCNDQETAELHAMFDIMLQQGDLSRVKQRQRRLRDGAKAQLKHLSFLSHDLCNSFLAITCNLESIKHELSKLPVMNEATKRVAASLAIIKRTRQGMHRFLEYERLRNYNARLNVAPVRLSDVVEPIVTMASGDRNASGPRIKVAIDPKATASTNPDLLTIILQNLISNAVKYCSCAAAKAHRPAGQEAGARAGVLVQAQPRKAKQGNSWIVSVTDDGPGIPQDRLDSLFKPFERLPQPGENAFADDAGFGLGLAIANQAARLLGTKIQVETQIGRGSTFSLKLPALRE